MTWNNEIPPCGSSIVKSGSSDHYDETEEALSLNDAPVAELLPLERQGRETGDAAGEIQDRVDSVCDGAPSRGRRRKQRPTAPAMVAGRRAAELRQQEIERFLKERGPTKCPV